MAEANIWLSPAEVGRWIESATFVYPRVNEAEQYAGFRDVPVFPTLWRRISTGDPMPSPNNLVRVLMDLADSGSIASFGEGAIRGRARKLVLDFGRELHAYTLLCGQFERVLWSAAGDLDAGVDFLVTLRGGQEVGVRVFMRSRWSQVDWVGVKEERLIRRGGKAPSLPIVAMTNAKLQPERTRNKVWLFRPVHVQEVVAELQKANIFVPGQFPI